MDTFQQEEQIIGSLLSGHGIKMCGTLSDDDFHHFRKTFHVLNKMIEAKSIVNPIEVAQQSGIKTNVLLTAMSNAMPSIFESNVEMLKKNTALVAYQKIINKKRDGDISEIVSGMIADLQSISVSSNTKSKYTSDALLLYIKELEQREASKGNEMYIDIERYNKLCAGFHKKELTIIGARPSVGKSVLGLQFAYALAKRKFKVLFVSLEMADIQIIGRMVTRFSRVDHNKLRLADLTQDDWKSISMSLDKISDAPFILETKTRTIADLRTKIIEEQPDIVILDYIGLMRDKSEKFSNRYEEISSISRKLKLMTLDFNIPIVALAQLKRDAENRQPTLSDLRDSGSLEQDADNVVFLDRLTASQASKDGYGSESDCQWMIDCETPPTNIILEKQRDGGTGIIRTKLDNKELRFREV